MLAAGGRPGWHIALAAAAVSAYAAVHRAWSGRPALAATPGQPAVSTDTAMNIVFGTRTPNLPTDRVRAALGAIVLAVSSLFWHDAGFAVGFFAAWFAVTLAKHMYWHYRPPGQTPPADPRYARVHHS
jgi:hypothetical protein